MSVINCSEISLHTVYRPVRIAFVPLNVTFPICAQRYYLTGQAQPSLSDLLSGLVTAYISCLITSALFYIKMIMHYGYADADSLGADTL